MTIPEFRKQIEALGFDTQKRRKRKVIDIVLFGTHQCAATYAEIHPLQDVKELLNKKLKPEYIPPLG